MFDSKTMPEDSRDAGRAPSADELRNLLADESSPLVVKKRLPDLDPDIALILAEVESAIRMGIQPVRIPQGSSGSYFVRNRSGRTVGVYKPKNEEPYGHLNPKWTKWFQKFLFPCCFGRSCLLPNQGYLSEAGTSLVDEKLGLDLVPKTRVVKLASPAFNYSTVRRQVCERMSLPLPLKVGSLQVYVEGFSDAASKLELFASGKLPPQVQTDFRIQFERLCILDFIVRNTDRTLDNWLVKLESHTESENEIDIEPKQQKLYVRIAAIDNGLSFPIKHPDNWRAYPYSWAFLDFARIPFSQHTRDKFLPLLSNEKFADELSQDLFALFKQDPAFDKSMFLKQMSVMRGQIQNCIKALSEGLSPLQMVKLPTFTVKRRKDETLTRSYLTKRPWFSWW
eukprot:TRINITY_DN16369_c0_g1::TRINITY_DN16369_c0_g1_i1::g.29495::m.29495 TRINITY_DN16369_c0_g1::TRINITY_DN16369_c0_g1_i1::g.29495  ORF type:complete len:395 (+),score=48.01,sp/Q5ZIK0/P4K2B_CHICK/49.34/8e-125,PI3_PI4_kinase/PF00454.22/1.5e-41,Peptidase_S7/PF00949.16/0.18 TRINITY_DN16369_c0_g1_i1:106-1290(+)